jgi:hypothetical protein
MNKNFCHVKILKNCLELIATKNSSRVTYEVGVETYQRFVFFTYLTAFSIF